MLGVDDIDEDGRRSVAGPIEGDERHRVELRFHGGGGSGFEVEQVGVLLLEQGERPGKVVRKAVVLRGTDAPRLVIIGILRLLSNKLFV